MGRDNSTEGPLEVQAVSVSAVAGKTLRQLASTRGTVSAFMPVSRLLLLLSGSSEQVTVKFTQA